MPNIKPSDEEIERVLGDLKADGKSLYDCIVFFRQTYRLDLSECKDIVLNSKVWADEKVAYIRNSEQAEQEFLEAWADDEKTKNSIFYKFYKFFIPSK